MRFLIIAFILTISICGYSKPNTCNKYFKDPKIKTASEDSSARSGILMHGEHWVDLILAQTGSIQKRRLKAFKEITEQILAALQKGAFDTINEKIDGSPSIVLGFDSTNQFFVAYKGHFSKKDQTLLTHLSEAKKIYNRSEQLQNIFTQLFQTLEARMKTLPEHLKAYVFQGDLLFVEGDSKRILTDTGVQITPNLVTYTLSEHHPLFSAVRSARIGFVLHTVGKKSLDGKRVLADDVSNETALQEIVQHLSSPDIFAIDSLRHNVRLEQPIPLETQSTVRTKIQEIEKLTESLTPEFINLWGGDLLAQLRVYINTGLRPPNTGGIFEAIAKNQTVAPKQFSLDFQAWLRTRSQPALDRKLQSILESHSEALNSALQAYFLAIEIQSQLLPLISESFVSKLGEGIESEGIMLKTEDTVVKLVDRLNFTLKNNQKWNRNVLPSLEKLPHPFNTWKPGDRFVLMKGQPVHPGHIQMIREASTTGRVFVIASDKEPFLEADKWTQLKATDTKTQLKNHDYTYVFSKALRAQILKTGLKGHNVEVVVVNPNFFWKYVETAQSMRLDGQVALIVGEKEISENRYTEQAQSLAANLILEPQPLQENGVSGTTIRKLIRIAALGTLAERTNARAELDAIYASVIPAPTTRLQIIRQLIKEWKLVDEKAQQLLQN